MMKLGYTTMLTPELSGTQAICVARKYGYDAVALRLNENQGELTIGSTSAEIAQIADAYKSEDILPAALMCYNPRADSAEKVERITYEYTIQALEIAAQIGAKNIRLFGDQERSGQFASALAKAVEKSGTGVGIVMQNHRGCADHKGVAEISRLTGTPLVGLVFSPDHCKPDQMEDIIREVKGITKEVYATNKITINMETADYEPKLIDQGELDWVSIYSALDLYHFDGIVAVKWERIWKPHVADYTVVLPYTKAWFDKMRVGSGK